MTTQELENKMDLRPCLHGHFIVTINFRGGEYWYVSTNTLAYDAIKSGEPNYYTKKQALQTLWDECKEFNSLK